MRVPYIFAATFFAATVSAAAAQDAQPRESAAIQRWPSAARQSAPDRQGRQAVPREQIRGSQGTRQQEPQARAQGAVRNDRFQRDVRPEGRRDGALRPEGRRDGALRPEGRRDGALRGQGALAQQRNQGQVLAQRRAEPRGGRPQGNNPQTGVARPRGGSRPGVGPGRRVYAPPRVYNNYYYSYPRRSYPYGYGGFGLGYFYYDPYVWRGNSWVYGSNYGSSYGYGYGYPGAYAGYGYDVGKLRLQVQPRDAEVFIDGYFSGIVDDFDGRFQGLTLETGGYSVEIVAPGFEPLRFDVRVTPGRTTTYRGELLPLRP